MHLYLLPSTALTVSGVESIVQLLTSGLYREYTSIAIALSKACLRVLTINRTTTTTCQYGGIGAALIITHSEEII